MLLGQLQIACIAQVREVQRTYNYDDSAQGKTPAEGVARSRAQASLIDLRCDEDEITRGLGVAAGSVYPPEDPEDLI